MKQFSLMILDKLAEIKAEDINEDTTIYITNDGETERIKDIRSLDLSHTKIKELPDTIGCLTSLQMLNISNTQLTTLPDSIGNLTSLQMLNISNTQLTTLPESTGNLKSLQRLVVSDTQITTLPESIGNLTDLSVLYAGGTQLTTLPESIGNLTALKELVVSRTKIATLPESIGNLTSLKKLYVRRTQLTKLPDRIGSLISLKVLNTRRTPLTMLPEKIGNLICLQSLDVSYTRLTTLPESIGVLTDLNELCASGTQLTTLPDSIGSLTSLKKLNAGRTQLATLPESIGNLICLQSLDVRRTQLTTLPESIGNLTALNVLCANGMPLTTLPESIGNLTSLQRLDVSYTQLTTLPESIGNLTALNVLHVNAAQLATLPESVGNLKGLKELDVRRTQLTTLPESIGNLTALNVLYASDTQLTTLPESIGNLVGLKELHVSRTRLVTLPESIGNLKDLNVLHASDTQLTTLPESIGNLTVLKELDVSRTQLVTLPESIGSLISLQKLGARKIQLTTLPESIGNLLNLKVLDVNAAQLTTMPESVGNLSGLQEMDVRGTQLTMLPECIGNLTGLKELDVRGTQLTKIPESIGNLTGLKGLNARGTQLTTLPKSIGNLQILQKLDVSKTKLTMLPESIGNLTGLKELNVRGTQLTTLPRDIGNLRNLERLDFSEARINSLKTDLWVSHSLQTVFLEELSLDRIPGELIKLNLKIIPQRAATHDTLPEKGIFIYNLTLSKQPISLFYQKRELIEQYFNEEMVSVNSAKIIFLGDGEVGKTYTLKRLLNDGKKATKEHPYPTQTTHGVLIKPYHVNEGGEQYDIKLWDFGGQQIMHSMHRCFLTERSCYVVMLSTRTDRDLLGQARYWLRTVSSLAPNAPVIVLVNQWSKNLKNVDEYRLREEFKNIKEFLYFSVVESEDEQFLTLKEYIMEQVRQLDCYGMEFPKSWYGLMTDLEKESESKNYISKSAYYRMCFERGLRYEDNGEEGIYDWLLDWFNDLGVCFSYNKNSNSQRLSNYELLNPQWLTRAAYVIVNSGESIADNGILTKDQIKVVLTDTEPLDFDDLGKVTYEPNEIEYVLEILRKFQISYQLPDGRELLPVLCNENSSGSARPEWFIPGEMQHTLYEFQYEYLPDTIIHRLMIFCYQSHYVVRDRWRKGMRVDFGGENSKLTAVIDSGNENQSITIDIYSDGLIPSWEFLSKLREEILQINAELSLKAKDFINMETDGIKDRYSVEMVLKNRSKGWTKLPADNEEGAYDISEILGSAYGPAYAAIIEKVIEIRKGDLKGIGTGDILNQILAYLEKLNNHPQINELLQLIIKALQAMQGNKLYYRNQENSNNLEDYRNQFVSDYLRAAGYNCSDQQPGGTGAAGEKPGERDFIVRDENGSEFLIYEGLNLTATNNNRSDKHLEKLLDNYNPMGLPFGVLTIYLECDRDKFRRFTDSYKKHISQNTPKSFVCIGEPNDIPSNGHFLACMKMKYETGGLDFYIYHIIVRVAP